MAAACILPSVLYLLAMFVYPFLYTACLSLHPPKLGGLSFANYFAFFAE